MNRRTGLIIDLSIILILIVGVAQNHNLGSSRPITEAYMESGKVNPEIYDALNRLDSVAPTNWTSTNALKRSIKPFALVGALAVRTAYDTVLQYGWWLSPLLFVVLYRNRRADPGLEPRRYDTWLVGAAALAFAVMLYAQTNSGWIAAAAGIVGFSVMVGMLTSYCANTDWQFFSSRPLQALAVVLAVPFLEKGLLYTGAWLTANTGQLVGTTVSVPVTISHEGSASIALFLTACVFAPLIEEVIFREGAMRAFNGTGSTFVALVATSVLFAVLHNYGYGGWPIIASAGLTFGLVRLYTGALAPAMVAHAWSNFVTLCGVAVLV